MIKRIDFDPKAELSHEEFVDHWENVHGPLALKVPGIRRYVQSHITGQHFRPDIPAQTDDVDGIAGSGTTALKTLSDRAKHRKRRRFTLMVR